MADATPAANDPEKIIPLVLERENLVLNQRSFGWITNRVCGIVENRQPLIWWVVFLIFLPIWVIGVGGGLTYLVSTGVGVWGNNNTTMWGWPIVNFVFWIGIGHAGTLISAILFLTRQDWRIALQPSPYKNLADPHIRCTLLLIRCVASTVSQADPASNLPIKKIVRQF